MTWLEPMGRWNSRHSRLVPAALVQTVFSFLLFITVKPQNHLQFLPLSFVYSVHVPPHLPTFIKPFQTRTSSSSSSQIPPSAVTTPSSESPCHSVIYNTKHAQLGITVVCGCPIFQEISKLRVRRIFLSIFLESPKNVWHIQ